MDSIIAQSTFHSAAGTDDTASYLCFNARNSIPSLFIPSIMKKQVYHGVSSGQLDCPICLTGSTIFS
ncbi:MAG: hypothetical protein IJ075_00060, partial [Lachnospiraceae bacterium]|nr:hypothetical protein [Lachnospiraceae bacterium]